MDTKNSNDELNFLNTYDSSAYEKPSVAVDLLVFTIENEELKIVMINRNSFPFKDCLSLPGVFVGIEESLDSAVNRAIYEKAGLKNIYFEQLYTWGEIKRDPRMRIISVSYLAIVPIEMLYLNNGTDTSAALYSVNSILSDEKPIAFDHKKIIQYGKERMKGKAEYSKIAFKFLPKEFTLCRLQNIYEILLERSLYKANFRKKIIDLIEPTDNMTSGDAHRPSRYYKERTN